MLGNFFGKILNLVPLSIDRGGIYFFAKVPKSGKKVKKKENRAPGRNQETVTKTAAPRPWARDKVGRGDDVQAQPPKKQ